MYHAKSLHTAYMFLPSGCPLIQTIHGSYQRNHLAKKKRQEFRRKQEESVRSSLAFKSNASSSRKTIDLEAKRAKASVSQRANYPRISRQRQRISTHKGSFGTEKRKKKEQRIKPLLAASMISSHTKKKRKKITSMSSMNSFLKKMKDSKQRIK